MVSKKIIQTPFFLIVVGSVLSGALSLSVHAMENVQQSSERPALSLLTMGQSPYFDTKILSDDQQVTEKLKKDGFQEVTFSSPDGLKINGLLREVPNPEKQILYCAGFFPGKMQGISTYFPMFRGYPQDDATMLFFDARGHGKSEGTFFKTIGSYSMHEHKDIIGGLKLLHDKNPQVPIIIHGICAGAFHAVRALIVLQKEHQLEQYPVKGLIFDSGFSSVMQMVAIPGVHIQQKVLPGALRFLYPDKSTKEIQGTCICRAASLPIAATVAVGTWWYTASLKKQDPQTRIDDDIAHIPCPILFIHSQDDSYVPYAVAKVLALKSKEGHSWEIEKGLSEHTYHHLKLKEPYQGNVSAFIDACLQKVQSKHADDQQALLDCSAQKIYTTTFGYYRFLKAACSWPAEKPLPTTVELPRSLATVYANSVEQEG